MPNATWEERATWWETTYPLFPNQFTPKVGSLWKMLLMKYCANIALKLSWAGRESGLGTRPEGNPRVGPSRRGLGLPAEGPSRAGRLRGLLRHCGPFAAIYIYPHMYITGFIYKYMHVHTNDSLCICTCHSLCLCLSLYIYICTHIYINIYIYIWTYMYTYTHTHIAKCDMRQQTAHFP